MDIKNIAEQAKAEATRWLQVEDQIAKLSKDTSTLLNKFENDTDLALDIVKAKLQALEDMFAKARSTQLNRRALEAIELLKPTMLASFEISRRVTKIYNAAPSAISCMAEETQVANS